MVAGYSKFGGLELWSAEEEKCSAGELEGAGQGRNIGAWDNDRRLSISMAVCDGKRFATLYV